MEYTFCKLSTCASIKTPTPFENQFTKCHHLLILIVLTIQKYSFWQKAFKNTQNTHFFTCVVRQTVNYWILSNRHFLFCKKTLLLFSPRILPAPPTDKKPNKSETEYPSFPSINKPVSSGLNENEQSLKILTKIQSNQELFMPEKGYTKKALIYRKRFSTKCHLVKEQKFSTRRFHG